MGGEFSHHWATLALPKNVNEVEYTGTLMTEARIKEADKYKKGKYKNKKMEYIDILFFIQKALNFH